MSGPGTELRKLLKAAGFKERAGCDCKKYAGQMDANGVVWCKAHRETILRWLIKSARKQRLPFLHRVAYAFIDQAIKAAEKGEAMGKKKAKGKPKKSLPAKPRMSPAAAKFSTMDVEPPTLPLKPLANYFQEVYVVSLGRRSDRLQDFLKRLPTDWPFPRPIPFEAIDGKKCPAPEWWNQGNPAWGCYQSHLTILQDCLNRGVQSVLLLEDDAIFCDGFAQQAKDFLGHLPENWGMVYLGGQHLHENAHPPKKVNDWVYRPYNVNRTHAFALRGPMMRKVYKHLHRKAWTKGNHIDHHLGLLHQRREDPIFTPKEWLVGQAEGYSDISCREKDGKFWKPAEAIAAVDASTLPFVAVLGLHSSGSSCLAGVLYHLGLHLGNKLGGFYGTDPQKSCGFEAAGLVDICEKAIPFPAVQLAQPKGKAWQALLRWINDRKREAFQRNTIAAGKYPQLCRLGNQLHSICGGNLKVIESSRPLEDSIKSMVARTKKPRDKIAAHLKWLEAGKQELMDRLTPDQKLTVSYAKLLSKPLAEVGRIIKFLGITPNPEQVQAAVAWVDPEKRHVGA